MAPRPFSGNDILGSPSRVVASSVTASGELLLFRCHGGWFAIHHGFQQRLAGYFELAAEIPIATPTDGHLDVLLRQWNVINHGDGYGLAVVSVEPFRLYMFNGPTGTASAKGTLPRRGPHATTIPHSTAAGEASASPAAPVPYVLSDALPGYVPEQFFGLIGGDQQRGGKLPRCARCHERDGLPADHSDQSRRGQVRPRHPFSDKAVDALGHYVRIDGWCKICLDWHHDTPVEDRVEYPPDPMWALKNLPISLFVGANRYTTDDTHVLHLWTGDGQSFDVMWPRVAGDGEQG